MICGETLYRTDDMLLLCLDRVMREVHAGVCGLHMGKGCRGSSVSIILLSG